MSWWVFLDIILFDKIILHLFCELQGSNPPKPLALRKLLQVAFKHKCPSPTMNHIFYIVHTVQLQTIRNRLSWICHLSAYTPSQHVHTLSLSPRSTSRESGRRKIEMNDGLMLGLEHSDVSFSQFQKGQDGRRLGGGAFKPLWLTALSVHPYTLYTCLCVWLSFLIERIEVFRMGGVCFSYTE